MGSEQNGGRSLDKEGADRPPIISNDQCLPCFEPFFFFMGMINSFRLV